MKDKSWVAIYTKKADSLKPSGTVWVRLEEHSRCYSLINNLFARGESKAHTLMRPSAVKSLNLLHVMLGHFVLCSPYIVVMVGTVF